MSALRDVTRPAAPLRAAIFVIVATSAAFAGALVFDRLSHRQQQDAAQDDFEQLVAGSTDAVRRHLASYEGVLWSARDFLTASAVVGREGWRGFASGLRLKERFPAIQSVGFVSPVADDQIDRFLERMRRDEPFDVWPPRTLPEHQVVTLVEPRDVASPWLGFDLASNAVLSAAADAACDGDRLTFAHDATQPASLLLPVFFEPQEAVTPCERRRRLRGWVVATFAPERLLDAAELRRTGVRLSLSEPRAGAPLAEEDSRVALRSVALGGAAWRLRMEAVGAPSDASAAASLASMPLLGGGVGILATALAFFRSRSRRRSEFRATQSVDLDASQLMNDVAHELRTPLTVIKGNAELLLQGLAGPLSPDQSECLDVVLDRSCEMAHMVDNALQSSRLDTGKLRIDRRRCTAEQVLEKTRSQIARALRTHRAKIEEEIAPGLPLIVADPESAASVVTSLVMYTVRFAEDGVNVSLHARAAADGGVEFAITNESSPFAPEHVAVIRDALEPGLTATTPAQSHVFGLRVARSLAAVNLGALRVEEGDGGAISICLKLPPDDVRTLLERFIAHLGTIRSGAASLSILHLTRNFGPPTQEMSQVLRSKTAPTDLLLDGTDEDWWLIGPSSDSIALTSCLRSVPSSPFSQDLRDLLASGLRVREVATLACGPSSIEPAMRHLASHDVEHAGGL